MKQLILILLISIATSSCSNTNGIDKRLGYASSLMNEYPDSALFILEELGQETKSFNAQNKAYYALLLTQAKDKNYHFETDDSIISIAVKYYEQTNQKQNLFLSLYYKALISFNKGDYSNSIIDALRAQDISKELDTALYSAKVHELLADIYNNSYNLDIAILHRKKAYAYYLSADKKNNATYSLIDLAREYDSYENHDKAIAILDSIERNTENKDSMILGFLYDSYMRPLLKLGKKQEALSKFRLAQNYFGRNSYYLLDYPSASIIFLENELTDSAEYYLNYIADNPQYANDENYHKAKYKLQIAKNNYTASVNEFEKMFDAHNAKINQTLKQSVAFKERDYYNSKSLIEHMRAEKYAIIALSSVFFLITICLCFIYKVKRDKQKLDERMQEAHELILQVQNQKNIMIKQHILVSDLFQSHYVILDTLSNKYFEKKDSEAMRKTIVKDFEKEVAKMKHPDSIKKLEKIVDDCRDNIIHRLKEQFPRFKEKDILFLSLIFAGFSPRSVCLFADLKIGNYYNKKARIRKRIELSNAPDKFLFISALDNPLFFR